MDIKAKILYQYPFPIALTYHNADNAREAVGAHDQRIKLLEVTLKYLASICIAQFLRDELEDPRVKQSLSGLFRPSLGQWNGFLREILNAYKRVNRANDMLVAELYDAYNKKQANRPAMALALNELVNYLDGRTDSAVSSLSLRQFFDTMINYRNKTVGHGAINRYHCEKINDPLFNALEEMLDQLDFLQEYKLVYVEDVRVRRGNYTHEMISYMGSTPPSRLKEAFVTANQDEYRVEEQLYLCRRGTFVPMLSLHPLVIAWQNDVLFLNESERDRDIEYLSYQSGQIKKPDRLLEDFKEIVGSVIAQAAEPSFDRLRQQAIAETDGAPSVFEQANEAYQDDNWAVAAQLFAQVAQDDARYAEAQKKLAEAQQQLDLLQRYNRAQQWMQQRGWDQAEAVLKKLEQDAPGYRDVRGLLTTVQMEKAESETWQRLYDQAQSAAQAQQWDRAFDLFKRLHETRPDLKDVGAQFAAHKLLNDLYSEGLEAISGRRWAEAQTSLRRIQAIEPAYKNIAALLARAEQELETEGQLAGWYSQARAHMALEEWDKALELLDQIDDQMEGYRDVNLLIEQVQGKLLIPCSKCGTLTPPQHKFCGKCGTAMHTWICWRCQSPVPEERKFCGKCGAPKDKSQTIRCPQCQHENPVGRKFCGKCGFILK